METFQCRSRIIVGEYPLPAKYAIKFAAIAFEIDNGQYSFENDERLQIEYQDYLPDLHKFNQGDAKFSSKSWISQIVSAYKALSSKGFQKIELMIVLIYYQLSP